MLDNDDSSAFCSSDYETYIGKLQEKVDHRNKVLTNRERSLLKGVPLKRNKLKNLFVIGLKGVLKEAKREKIVNPSLFTEVCDNRRMSKRTENLGIASNPFDMESNESVKVEIFNNESGRGLNNQEADINFKTEREHLEFDH